MIDEDPDQPIRALFSFHYYRNEDLGRIADRLTVAGVRPDIFADSGAFSAHSGGVKITVDEYAEWLDKWRDLVSVYANLDVIGDHRGSMRNLVELERQGFSPLPVFHTHTEDLNVLEDLCERYEYVAIGGMVGYRASAIFPWLVKCHKVARKHGTALHGFGQTSSRPLADLPWYSVDSSSWTIGFRYGSVPLFDASTGKISMMDMSDPQAWIERADVVRSYGHDPANFYVKARNTREHNASLAARSYRRAERWCRARHGLIQGPGENVGLRIYLAESAGGGADLMKVADDLTASRA